MTKIIAGVWNDEIKLCKILIVLDNHEHVFLGTQMHVLMKKSYKSIHLDSKWSKLVAKYKYINMYEFAWHVLFFNITLFLQCKIIMIV